MNNKQFLVLLCALMASLIVFSFSFSNYETLSLVFKIGAVVIAVLFVASLIKIKTKKTVTQQKNEEVEIENDVETETEIRDRGRPRKPCVLAQNGIISCPLTDNYVVEPTPELVNSVTNAVLNEFSKRIIKQKNTEQETQTIQTEEPKKEKEKKKKPDKTEEKNKEEENEKDELGELLNSIGEILPKGK